MEHLASVQWSKPSILVQWYICPGPYHLTLIRFTLIIMVKGYGFVLVCHLSGRFQFSEHDYYFIYLLLYIIWPKTCFLPRCHAFRVSFSPVGGVFLWLLQPGRWFIANICPLVFRSLWVWLLATDKWGGRAGCGPEWLPNLTQLLGWVQPLPGRPESL